MQDVPGKAQLSSNGTTNEVFVPLAPLNITVSEIKGDDITITLNEKQTEITSLTINPDTHINRIGHNTPCQICHKEDAEYMIDFTHEEGYYGIVTCVACTNIFKNQVKKNSLVIPIDFFYTGNGLTACPGCTDNWCIGCVPDEQVIVEHYQ